MGVRTPPPIYYYINDTWKLKGFMGFSVSVLGYEPYPLNTFNLTINKPVLLTHTNIRDKYWRAITHIL